MEKTYKIIYRTGEKNYLGIDIRGECYVKGKNREEARTAFEQRIHLIPNSLFQGKQTRRYDRTAIEIMNLVKD